MESPGQRLRLYEIHERENYERTDYGFGGEVQLED